MSAVPESFQRYLAPTRLEQALAALAERAGGGGATVLAGGTDLMPQLHAGRVPLGRMIDWVADWVLRGMPQHGKPTGYEVRAGAF